jgi:hypothetical protein
MARSSGTATRIGGRAIKQYGSRLGRLISVRSTTPVVIATGLAGLVAVMPTATLAETHVPGPPPVPRVITTAVHEIAPVTQAASAPLAALDIDVPGLRRHVQSIAKLIGHPARELAAKLGAAATIGDGTIEWNLSDLGVDAASAYGYASVADGEVTGFVIRGRASLDKLLQLHLHRPLQLTRAGGERPSYSITAGE